MKNVLLISADFPYTYAQFAVAYKNNGMNVLVIGGTPYEELDTRLKESVTEYVRVSDMENIQYMKDTVGYLINKYGPIDYLESNNEYWLRSDAILRETFNIKSGIWPKELDDYQRKSSMKKYYQQAGVKVAPYIIVESLEQLEEFAKKFGYPLFTKPDIGVGAGGNYKLSNHDDLVHFLSEKDPNCPYICEPFIEGELIQTFDGICDSNSDVVVYDSMICPPSIFDVKEKHEEMFYYVLKEVDPKLVSLGKKVIKAMGLKNRFFHGEYFIAKNSVKGYFDKGDIVGLEVNIRTPGGYSPDMIDFAISGNIYQILADVVCFGKARITDGEHFYAATASRRDNVSYFFSHDDVMRTFKNDICFEGRYPLILSDIMGNQFYMAKFKSLDEVKLFKEYVERKSDTSLKNKPLFISHLGGEDLRMMKEKNSKPLNSDETICDRHIDGA